MNGGNGWVKKQKRTPRNYDGTRLTAHHVSDVLTEALTDIREVYQDRPDVVISTWPEIIGPKLAPMTEAVSFVEGTLLVKVKNSTLYSLLAQHDKQKVLYRLRQKFPKMAIKNILFRIG
jgi:hypothetical protein